MRLMLIINPALRMKCFVAIRRQQPELMNRHMQRFINDFIILYFIVVCFYGGCYFFGACLLRWLVVTLQNFDAAPYPRIIDMPILAALPEWFKTTYLFKTYSCFGFIIVDSRRRKSIFVMRSLQIYSILVALSFFSITVEVTYPNTLGSDQSDTVNFVAIALGYTRAHDFWIEPVAEVMSVLLFMAAIVVCTQLYHGFSYYNLCLVFFAGKHLGSAILFIIYVGLNHLIAR